MSLDISLIVEIPVTKKGTGVFVRDNGQNRELTPEEVAEKFPGSAVGEDEYRTTCVYDANITHNLTEMADKAGVYEACWHPEDIGARKAKDIIPILEKGIEDMKRRPDSYKKFDSKNGWGLYVHFLPWLERYLEACREYPEAIIEAST